MSWWAELCDPSVRFDIGLTEQPPDEEAQMYWRELSLPHQDEAREFVTAREIDCLQAAEDMDEFAAVARRCCLVELEEKILRGFGVSARVVPELSIPYLDISEADRLNLRDRFPRQTEFLEAAFEIRADGVTVVKGSSGVPYPSADDNPPRHKYVAVFDARPCFGGLRSSFISPSRSVAEARCQYLYETLDQCRDLAPHVPTAREELAAAIAIAENQKNNNNNEREQYRQTSGRLHYLHTWRPFRARTFGSIVKSCSGSLSVRNRA